MARTPRGGVDVVGRALPIDGRSHTIVGVMPARFAFPDPSARFWLPYVLPSSAAGPGPAVFTALARVKPGVTLAQVEAEGTAAAGAAPAHRLTEFFFGKGTAPIVHARPLDADMTVAVRPALTTMTVAVALVLLVACVNVAGLLLSRGAARQREFAVRTAIGGSRGRLTRQIFTEGALLAAAGSLLGLLIGIWLLSIVRAAAPASLPRVHDIAVDGAAIGLWAAASVLAILVTGLVPALRGARVDPSDALPGGDRSSGSGFRSARARRLRDGLLSAEAALAVVLVVGASLLGRSFVGLVSVDAGYAADRVLVAAVELPGDAGTARTDRFIVQALDRVRQLPDVQAAGASAMIPLMKATAVAGITVPEADAGGKPTQGRARIYTVTPGYAEAIGLRLESGRFPREADRSDGVQTIVVNREFVRQHLAQPDAAGLRLPDLLGDERSAAVEIVGVVGNVLKDGNDSPPQAEVYYLHGGPQRIAGRINVVIRTIGDPAAIAADVRALFRDVDPDLVVDAVEPLASRVSASLDGPRFAAGVMGAFAGIAMLLAGIGLFGALSYSVSQRERELGVRAALGAQRSELLRLVVREGMTVVLPGIAIGIVGAASFARLMASLLFGISPHDAVAFAAAPPALLATSVLACLGPGLRAAAADPAAALRK